MRFFVDVTYFCYSPVFVLNVSVDTIAIVVGTVLLFFVCCVVVALNVFRFVVVAVFVMNVSVTITVVAGTVLAFSLSVVVAVAVVFNIVITACCLFCCCYCQFSRLPFKALHHSLATHHLHFPWECSELPERNSPIYSSLFQHQVVWSSSTQVD